MQDEIEQALNNFILIEWMSLLETVPSRNDLQVQLHNDQIQKGGYDYMIVTS